MGADEVEGAALEQPGTHVDAVPASGTLNEYVLWFGDPSDAQRAFAQLREEFQACRTRPDPTYRVDTSYLAYDQAAHPPIEEQLTGEITRVPKAGGDLGYGNGLSVARLGQAGRRPRVAGRRAVATRPHVVRTDHLRPRSRVARGGTLAIRRARPGHVVTRPPPETALAQHLAPARNPVAGGREVA